MVKRLLIGIDAGGTTFKYGMSEAGGPVLAQGRVPTTSPSETIACLRKLCAEKVQSLGGDIAAIGIASFGPLEIDPLSSQYGTILKTPKEGWSGTPLLRLVADAFGVPIAIDTDVNAAVRAELASQEQGGIERAAYVTIGTGVGVGVMTVGHLAGTPLHPELGHIRVARHPEDHAFDGVCPFHGDCLEGLAAAPALIQRFGPLEDLSTDHEVWELAGYYVGQLCLTLSSAFRLQRILIGGGVSEADGLLPAVRRSFAQLNGSYLPEGLYPDDLIQKARLGEDAGLAGALHLAETLYSTGPAVRS